MFAVAIIERVAIFSKFGPRLRSLRRSVLLDFVGFEVLTALAS